MSKNNYRWLGMTVATQLLVATGANAAEDGQRSGSASLEEIVVSAQRREEAVQDVPASIEVFNAPAMESLGVTNVQDIARLTPGLYSSPRSAGNNVINITIRGVGSDISSPSTAVYINDTPIQVRSIGDAQAADTVYPLVFDLERVEVLRGPQGTLFGSSAQGGAVRFITREPGDNWGGHTLLELSQVRHGELGYQAGAAGGGPLNDKAGFRGSVYYQKVGGWIDLQPRKDQLIGNDVFPNKDDVNSADNMAATAALKWQVTDNFTLTPSMLWQKQQSDGQSRFWREASGGGRYVNEDLFPAEVDNEFWLASLTARWQLASFDVYSTTSYMDRTRDSTADLSFGFNGFLGGDATTPVTSVTFSMQNPQKQFSQEFRLQGLALNDRLNWVVGAFYRDLKQEAFFTEYMPFFDAYLTSYFGGPTSAVFGSDLIDGQIGALQHDDSRDTELAGFGQLDFEIVDGWTLTGGMRVVRTKNEGEISRRGPLQQTPGELRLETSATESVWLPKVGLKYEPASNWMMYATASRGFRPGGGNTTPTFGLCQSGFEALGLTEVPSTYDADYLNSYEIGAKGNTRDGRFSLATSVYRADWKDRQDSVSLGTCGLRYIDNLGSAHSQGVEMQFMAAVVDGLKLGVSAAYNDSAFEDTIVIGTVPVVTEGDQLDMPPWMVSAALDYSFTAFSNHEAYFHLDGQYSSAHRVLIGADQAFPVTADRPSLVTAAARIGLRMGTWDLSLFANNLFDTDKIVRTSAVASVLIDQIQTPRTIGMTVRSTF